ncbi:SDR family NAD(P)-dependent oxidoreductase [Neisseria perflava]|uniref:SDR family NAD(P)-dependent oxidoreductase n=1 Tax=Neisseria perflava TaxID=33053 RepID=UPI003F597004|nr:nucleoside-diphosphate-sugar epimerase [Neisseria perflava]
MAEMQAPDCAVFGLGYLGRPLAQKLYEHGSRVAAVKRSLTSDDINLPIELDCADLNQADIFQTAVGSVGASSAKQIFESKNADARRKAQQGWTPCEHLQHSSRVFSPKRCRVMKRQQTLTQHWTDKPTWFCLLPPSALQDYAGTLRQWLALAESAGIKHLIFTSSTSVYGDRVRECDETSPPEPQSAAARSILAVEQMLLESCIPNVDILRLGGLYSAERHPVSCLILKDKIGGGRQPVNSVHRDIAVDALFQTALRPQGKRVRNIVEPHHPSRAEFYTAEAAKLGLPAPDFDPDDLRGGKIVNTVCNHPSSL